MSEESRTNVVDEVGARPTLDIASILKLRTAARNNTAESRALQAKLNALDSENISREEKTVRQAVYNWILGRLDIADAAARNVAGPLGNLVRGEVAYDRGRFAEAIPLLQQAATASGNSPVAIARMVTGLVERSIASRVVPDPVAEPTPMRVTRATRWGGFGIAVVVVGGV